MKTEHHEQRIDFENGYIIATREDTEKYQDLDIKEYTSDGELYTEQRILYNIQYDYIRSQDWLGKTLIHDAIQGMDTYGHLQSEYTEGGLTSPEDWVNPYPDNHEPVRPEGADMFHTEGISFVVSFPKTRMSARANLYIYDDLDDYHRQSLDNLITHIHPSIPWLIEEEEKESEAALGKYNANEARRRRLEALEKHGKKIGVDIPIDPRFID